MSDIMESLKGILTVIAVGVPALSARANPVGVHHFVITPAPKVAFFDISPLLIHPQ